MNVGFYYMANAAGRLVGTLLSGVIYQYLNFTWCLWMSAIFILLTSFVAFFLHPYVDAAAAVDPEENLKKLEVKRRDSLGSESASA